MSIVDLSTISDISVDDAQIGQFIQVSTVLLSNKIQYLQFQEIKITKLLFNNQSQLRQINIEYCPKFFCDISDKENINNIIDLSKFNQLNDILLNNVQNNILLPDKLNKLEISQQEQYQFQLQNKTIKCNHIKICYFDLSNIAFEDCQYINFKSIKISCDTLDLSSQSKLKCIILQYIQHNIIIPDCLDLINLRQIYSSRYKLLNKFLSCRNVEIWNYDVSEIIISDCFSIKLWNPIYGGNILDLSMQSNLKSTVLSDINNDIILPKELDKLELSQSQQFQYKVLNKQIFCLEVKISNFDLTDILLKDYSLLELYDCQFRSLSLTSFLNDGINNLRFCCLNNINFKYNLSILDLTNFKNLIDLQLININFKNITFGQYLQEISISQNNSEYYYINFLDFSSCFSLKKALISNYNIRQVYIFNSNIQFVNCQIRIIDLRKSFPTKFNIESYFQNYNQFCKFIIIYKSNNNQNKQQFVYKAVNQKYIQVNYTPCILAQQILEINNKIYKIINN